MNQCRNMSARSTFCWWWIIHMKLIGWLVGCFARSPVCWAIVKRMPRRSSSIYRLWDGRGNLPNLCSWNGRMTRIRRSLAGKSMRYSIIRIQCGWVFDFFSTFIFIHSFIEPFGPNQLHSPLWSNRLVRQFSVTPLRLLIDKCMLLSASDSDFLSKIEIELIV